MSAIEQMTKPVLVLGGTGKSGGRVVRRLTDRGVPVRVGSRSGTPPFDWDDRATWSPVLDGVAAVYVTYQPDIGFSGAAETVGAFARLAVAHGASRLVLLSGRNEAGALRSEEQVRASGGDWTIVRSSFFAQNFSEGLWVDAVLGGVLAIPAGEVTEPFIDIDDIADIVVAALTQEGHSRQLYEVTGPRLLGFGDVAAELSRATGRDVRYVPVSRQQFSSALAAAGLPMALVDGLAALFAEVLDGRGAYVADGVERALGRRPRDFAEYARDAAASGAWAAAPVRT